MTLSETHINNNTHNDLDDLYEIEGFQFIKRNRNNGKDGGVAMFISEKIQWKRRTDLENEFLECLWIEIFQKCSKSFLVGSIYRPPERLSIYRKILKNISKI